MEATNPEFVEKCDKILKEQKERREEDQKDKEKHDAYWAKSN